MVYPPLLMPVGAATFIFVYQENYLSSQYVLKEDFSLVL